MTRHIICNQARCKKCDTLIISHHDHDFKSCKCGSLSVDGGNSYTRRLFNNINDFEELTVYSEAPYEVIRQNLHRGSMGKHGNGPLTWVKLSDIDDDYLTSLIDYVGKFTTRTWQYEYYIKEKEFRECNYEISD